MELSLAVNFLGIYYFGRVERGKKGRKEPSNGHSQILARAVSPKVDAARCARWTLKKKFAFPGW